MRRAAARARWRENIINTFFIIFYRMRTKLSEKYPQERENICKRLIEILEIDPADNSFLLCYLDEDKEKQAI